MKTNFGPQKIMFPCPTTLVVTGNMGKANIATIAWVSLITINPPTIGISVGTKSFSGEQIKKTGEFTVNLACVDILNEADFCGITSGNEIDKFLETGLTKVPSLIIKAPLIKECPLNLECKLIQSNVIEETYHFIGKIVETHIDTDKLKDPNDHTSFNIETMDPLILIGEINEYRKIGKKVGDAYQAGQSIKISNQ